MSNTTPLNRRQFLGAAAGSMAAVRLGVMPDRIRNDLPEEAMMHARGIARPNVLEEVKHVDAGVLNVGYAEAGPANGPVVMLLHGWPYDIQSFADVVPLLTSVGYRVIVPYQRGYGSTHFRSASTARNGQQSAFAQDTIDLMDALKIDKAVIGGFDWGSRTAAIVGALWPERCKALALVSGYLIVDRKANQEPLPPKAELGWWYQYYFATDRGQRGYDRNRNEFNRLIWKIASPAWDFDDATYGRTAASFDNADHVAIVIHNYRWRLSLADGEPRYDVLEQKLLPLPSIRVPAITIASDFDGANADGKAYVKRFTGRHEHRVLAGIGHNVPQEAPKAFAQCIVDADHL